jgi:guanine deaminase
MLTILPHHEGGEVEVRSHKNFLLFLFALGIVFVGTLLRPHTGAGEVIAFRGSILHFLDDPAVSQNSYHYFDDGLLVIEDGMVKQLGHTKELIGALKPEQITDYRGRLIIPGFIDTHLHYPQMEMIASYGEQLLEWLKTYTFPTEKKYSDKGYARSVAEVFLDQLLLNGTTTALVLATVHKESVDAFFEAAKKRNLRMIAGKVLMDRNAPDYLLDTPATGYADSKELIKRWHNNGRLLYAVTPRFAPTSTPAQLEVVRKLLEEYPDVYLHTHLSENQGEIEWVKSLFPGAESYLKVYETYGLVRPRSLFAHSIYLDDKDFSTLAKHGGAIAFCPSSNLFLGSGLFNLREAEKYGVAVGLATDVGAGTSFSMLETMDEAYKVIQMHKAWSSHPAQEKPLSPLKAFYLATLGGARALRLDDKIGNFLPGKEADFVVLNPRATSLMKYRMAKVETLQERLFVLQVLGDDRAIEKTYILGHAWH